MDNFIKMVASGLRNMCNVPDYFLFIDDNNIEWTIDTDEILGIQCLHINYDIDFRPYGDFKINIIPCWKSENSFISDVIAFARGCEESVYRINK
jgi:hypothetical protein